LLSISWKPACGRQLLVTLRGICIAKFNGIALAMARSCTTHSLGEVTVPEHSKATVAVVSVEAGPAEVDPLPVLTFASAYGVPIAMVRLDWVGSARLGGLLSQALMRFA
jgi:hypothetical protein